MSSNNPIVALILEAYEKIEIAKYIAAASLALFTYDFIITLEDEVKYVWSAKWAFGRIAFHFNRCWTIAVLCVYMRTIFTHGVDLVTCRRAIQFYGYGVIFLVLNTTIIMSLRAWILFNRNRYVLIILSSACLAALGGCIAVFQIQMQQIIQIANPVPELITGCLTILPTRLVKVPYVIGLVLDTIIFIATLWRSLQLNQEGVKIPLIKCIMRDGMIYYFLNCASLATSVLLGLDNNVNNIALGSGYIIALHSTLCTRILLSLHLFNDEVKRSMLPSTSDNTAVDAEWNAGDRVRSGETSGRPEQSVELKSFRQYP